MSNSSQQGQRLPLHPLGTTGLQVPQVCVGSAPLGLPQVFAQELSEEQALATIRSIFAGPITFLDTAACYGESERRIGLVLRELGGLPTNFVLASKVDRDMKTGDFSGAQMRRSLERSLELLGLNSLHLLYLHDPEHTTFDAVMAPGGPMETLIRAKEEGLCEHLGVAGGPIDMMIRYVKTGLFEVALSHNRYTLLNREAEPLWDACVQHNVAAINAAPYGSGMLAKGTAAYPRYGYGQAPQAYVKRTERIEALCRRYEIPLGAVALQFSTRNPRIQATIVGMSRPERVTETVNWLEHRVPNELWDEINIL